MKSYGMPDSILNWIKDFLYERTQTVFANNCYSYPTSVKSGVPQGSVLGPLLFVLFINDLPDVVNNLICKLLTFADDTKIVSKISSTNDHINLQTNLNNIINWTKLNNMELNKDKFELLTHKFVNSPNLNLLNELPFKNSFGTYSAENIDIHSSSTVRDLGIFIDDKLNFNQHYSIIAKKSKQISGWVLNTFYSRDRVTMLTLFNSLVRSRLEFGCEVWNPYLKKDIVFIEQVQRSFTHKIIGMRTLDYWQRLKELKIMSLQRRRERIIIMHVWKIKNRVYPNSIDLEFKLHKRSNAMRAVLKPLPRIRGKLLNLFENSFGINACKLWNILPACLTHIDSITAFTKQLALFLSNVPDEPPLPGYPFLDNNSLTEKLY